MLSSHRVEAVGQVLSLDVRIGGGGASEMGRQVSMRISMSMIAFPTNRVLQSLASMCMITFGFVTDSFVIPEVGQVSRGRGG